MPGKLNIARSLHVEIEEFTVPFADYRRFAGLEIRADSDWHRAQEFVGPYGHSHHAPRVRATEYVLAEHAQNPDDAGLFSYLAHDFILRFGARDGWFFPCELEAWLLPEAEYYRREPETAETVAHFPTRPPDLRVLTRVEFTGGFIAMPRCGLNPVPAASTAIRELTGCEEVCHPNVNWHGRMKRDYKGIEPLPPGWRSTVSFATRSRK